MQGGEKHRACAHRYTGPKVVTNEDRPGSFGGTVLKYFSVDNGTSFGSGGDGVMKVHVERVACQRGGLPRALAPTNSFRFPLKHVSVSYFSTKVDSL